MPPRNHTNTTTTTTKLPTTKKMVDAALVELHSKKGCSLQAVKKFITQKYDVKITEVRKELIRKHLRMLLETNKLVKTTGRGLNGSFKLPSRPAAIKRAEPAKRTQGPKRTKPIGRTEPIELSVVYTQTESNALHDEVMRSSQQQETIIASTPLAPLLTRSRGTKRAYDSDTPLSSLGSDKTYAPMPRAALRTRLNFQAARERNKT